MNDSIDKMAETYVGDEDDAKAYQKAQSATIITQTRQINELRKKLEELSQQCEQLTIENTRLKTTGGDLNIEQGKDAETIAAVQLALLNNYSMQRELTLEETKKYEIYTKMTVLLKGKGGEKEQKDTVGSLSNEELLAAMKSMG